MPGARKKASGIFAGSGLRRSHHQAPQRGGEERKYGGDGRALAGEGGICAVFLGEDGGGAAHGHPGQNNGHARGQLAAMGDAAAHQDHQRHQKQPDDAVEDRVPVQQGVDVPAADDGADEEHGDGHVAVAGALDGLPQKGGQLPLGKHDEDALFGQDDTAGQKQHHLGLQAQHGGKFRHWGPLFRLTMGRRGRLWIFPVFYPYYRGALPGNQELQKNLQKTVDKKASDCYNNIRRQERQPRKPKIWGISSAGRALAWHARGHRFDPGILHQKDTAQFVQCLSFCRQFSHTSHGDQLNWEDGKGSAHFGPSCHFLPKKTAPHIQ